MTATRTDRLAIREAGDVVAVRQLVRRLAAELGFGLVDQTKLVTAASELARNAFLHGGGGEMRAEVLDGPGRCGIALTFEDRGPGIEDLELALRDGYSTGQGLGLGLGGAKRLVNDFEIDSRVGEGTRVRVIRWR
jgi:serine/threonine-protein kinase RsbT